MHVWARKIKLDLMHSFNFGGDVHKGGRVDLGEMGSMCDQGALYEIPN